MKQSRRWSKVTSDVLFDYWQAEVSVGYARLQYLFELKDKQGQSICMAIRDVLKIR